MAYTKLKYLTKDAEHQLMGDLNKNRSLYNSKNFSSLATNPKWNRKMKDIEVDLDKLKSLNSISFKGKKRKERVDLEVKSAKILWQSLKNFTPFDANRSGIWCRLGHVECIGYCFNRWENELKNDDAYKTHFFTVSANNFKRDHALSRLWYSYFYASKIVNENPAYNFDLHKVLEDITPAETRQSIIERPETAMISKLGAGIINTRINHANSPGNKKLVQVQQRRFMVEINKVSAGKVFELMSKADIDQLCTDALTEAFAYIARNPDWTG